MFFKFRYYLFFIVLSISLSKVDESAPNFYLRDLNNLDYFLSDNSNQQKPLVLSFFATWCEPCRIELPLLDSLASKHKNLNFVYIATGTEQKPLKKSAIKKYKSQLGLNQTILLDKYGRVFNKYTSNGKLPLTMVIDKGIIKYYTEKFESETSIDLLTSAISKTINE